MDVDLALAGNACKVSRQQALLARGADGRWALRNCGRRPVMINDAAVEPGRRAVVPAGDSLWEVGGLRMLFLPNRRAPPPPRAGAAAATALAAASRSLQLQSPSQPSQPLAGLPRESGATATSAPPPPAPTDVNPAQ